MHPDDAVDAYGTPAAHGGDPMTDPLTQPSFVPRETRPCVECGDPIAPGEAYVPGDAGPVHARHHLDDPPVAVAAEFYAHAREETYPGGP